MLYTTPEIESLIVKLTSYIMANRGNSPAFKNWTKQQIEDELRIDILNASCIYVTDEYYNIIGIVHGEADWNKQTFRVKNILAKDLNIVKQMVSRFDALFPCFEISAQRHGRILNYNYSKLKHKIGVHISN